MTTVVAAPGVIASSRRRTPAGSPYATAVLADNPLLYLRLDETSGASCANTGSLGGTATANGTFTRNVPAAHANLGVAVTLEGVGDNDYIAYPDNAALDLTGDFTYECWVKAASYPGGVYLMSKGRDSSSLVGYALTASGGFIAVRAGTSGQILSYATALSTGVWHHIVATRAGSAVALYLDGSSVATATSSPSVQATGKPLLVGIQQTELGFQGGFGGQVDEVAVYSAALSSTRVAAHYAAYNA